MKPNDPLYGKQWHLAQIGGLEKVWDYYSGVGTTVVVYDNGVEASHEDLNDNYVPGGAFTYGGTTYGSVPVSASDAHGTAVAGLIAAEANNGRGGAGVAWGADVAALNFLESVQFSSSSTVLAALRNAANFDVMNNSWGYSPLYQDSQSLAISGSSSLLLEGALAQVATSGRGGLGTVVVNASGNEGLNANGEGILASRHVIAVAASDRYGNVTSYSNWGSNIVVTAPGASYTTDRTGNAGYNMFGAIEPTGSDSLSNLNYTSVFGGTSASAPLVSGVVALMLEANPNLGWRDVKNILALSASQTGSALKAGPSGHELDAWSIQKSGNWNGGGTAFNVNYGFGMVNALSAVGMAEVWSDIYGAARTSSNEAKASGSFSGHLNILDNSTTYAQLNIASNIEVETVMVNVNVTHSYASDLRMALIAPDGSEVTLMHAEGGATLMRGGFQWAFGVEAFRGMSSGGQWRLRIDDLVGGDTGYITGFSVDAYGGASPSFAVHTFTDDFAMFKAVEATRGNLMSTTNGDWLNFAGVSGNMTFSAGQAIRLNGQIVAQINAAANFTRLATGAGNDTVTCGVGARQILLGMGDDLLVMDNATGIFSGGSHAPGGVSLNLGSGNTSGSWAAGDVVREFENAAGSDAGDDSLTGSAVANILSGNGGNDTISGGAQYDTIYGGNGNDIVYGGLGRDSIWLGFGNDHFEDDAQADVHGADLIYGGAGDDTINGGGGDDRFYGEDGADLIYGGLGADMIDGGSRYDTIYSQNGNDTVYGGTGRDYVNLGSDNDRYFDDAQDDAHGSDTVLAGAGQDTINGGGGADLFYGEDGNDLIYAGLGNDTIDGGSWADTIYGQNGFDVVYGGLGPDTVWLGNGDDRFYDDVQRLRHSVRWKWKRPDQRGRRR